MFHRYKGEDSYGVRQSYDGGHESYDAGRDSYSGRDSGMNSRRNERDSYSSRDNHNSAPAQDYLDDSRDFNSRPSRYVLYVIKQEWVGLANQETRSTAL